ncbi:MAG: UvrD-helicase domain-containing protein [Bacteroidales bacterium]|nr:UvrD-helicase domain-containing protein [Bacteroidales bacterium]
MKQMNQNDRPFKIYTASAGSGKTFTIVKEYLAICLGDNSDAYREILAVTFTNKAANEMKAKILNFILGIIDNSTETGIKLMKNFLLEKTGVTEQVLIERCKTLYTKILHNYSDMSVSTIDSFVQHLSRSFARELDLPSQYSVMLDDDDLVDEIIQLLSDEIGHNKFITKVLSQFVEYNLSEEISWNVKSAISDFITKLLKEDAYKKGCDKEITEIDEQKYNEIKEYVHGEYKAINENIDIIINELRQKENELGITDDDYAQKSRGLPSIVKKMQKRENCVTTTTTDKILSGENDWKNKKSKIIGNEMLYCFQNAVESYRNLSCRQFIFKLIEKDLYLYVLRNHIFELIKEYISESSQVHISEFNKRISDVLGDCSVPFIYERIGERYKHYFIDEFQDTSVLQWQNFLPLVDNSLAQGNMNLIVGDAKQSIYRFRSGEVEQIISLPKIYNLPKNGFAASCEEQFISSADKRSLSTNYRSCKNIIKFNNTFFRFAERYLANTDVETNLEHVFDDTEQIYNSKDGGLVSVELFSSELGTKDYKEKVYESMLSKINELHSEGVEYKDITIQVRSNREGTEIANYLVENGVEVISAESVQLQTSDKIQLIVSTLQYFVNDDNPVTMKTMSYFFEKTHEGRFMPLVFDNKNVRLEKSLHNELQSIHNQAYSLYDLCVQLCKFYDFNILEDVFVQYFMNMLYDWQCSHSGGVDAFMDYWERKKGSLSVQITGELNCVNIMTIHKSKGLEFKIVMYPFADTMLKTKQGFTKKEMWIQCADDKNAKDIPYLDAFLLPISKTELQGTEYEDILKREEQKSMLDTLDVMYVSMTRAKERLYIYTTDKVSKTDTGYNIFNDFFNDNLDIQHIKKENEEIKFDDYFLKKEEINVQEMEDRKIFTFGNADFRNENKSDSKGEDVDILELDETEQAPKSLNWFEKLSVEPDPTMIWSKNGTFLPDEWGTLVHEIFSKIRTTADANRAVRPYVNDGTLDEETAEKLISMFKKMSDIECLKPAYSDNAEVLNEMDIHTSLGNVVRPDRYAVTKNGIILIDYKTGKHNEKYHQQLLDYMIALREMNGNQDIKAYLVYLGDEIDVEEVRLDRLF